VHLINEMRGYFVAIISSYFCSSAGPL